MYSTCVQVRELNLLLKNGVVISARDIIAVFIGIFLVVLRVMQELGDEFVLDDSYLGIEACATADSGGCDVESGGAVAEHHVEGCGGSTFFVVAFDGDAFKAGTTK